MLITSVRYNNYLQPHEVFQRQVIFLKDYRDNLKKYEAVYGKPHDAHRESKYSVIFKKETF